MSRRVAGLMLLLCGTSSAADRFEAVREFIRAGLVEESVPSVAVAVAQNGRIVWEEGFGWADREKRIPATQHTMYSLASISKPITATGLMTLVQAGKVDLEKPANDYLGYARLRARAGDARDATVRRIADHTSGLPQHYQFFYSDEPFLRPSMDETILRYGNLITAPGETFRYSNLGYGILDYAIERVSGMSYAEFMRREVFLPLGMTRTSVDIDPALEPYTATRYGVDGQPIPFYTFDHPGASAVFSSAHDLVRFAMFHLKAHFRDQKAILSDAFIDEMHRDTAGRGDGGGYGLGFVVLDEQGHRVVSHTGTMGGVATSLRLFPAEKLAIVVLCNATTELRTTVADRLTAVMLPRWQPRLREKIPAPSFVPSDDWVGTWKGVLSTYLNDVPVELRFLVNGLVQAKIADQLPTLVSDQQVEDGVFSGRLAARIGTSDTDRYEYVVELSLRRRGELLNGGATALDTGGPRVRNALTHWMELRKVRDPAN